MRRPRVRSILRTCNFASEAESAGLAERLRDVAASVDPTLHVDEVRTLAEIYREHRFGDNLGAITIGAVTGSVLLLSAAGLYALMAFTVAQRRREIGIRSALGAQPGHLVAAVFRRAFWQIGAGSAAGMLAAYLAVGTCRSNRSAACRFPASSPARPRSCCSSASSLRWVLPDAASASIPPKRCEARRGTDQVEDGP